MAYDPTSSNYKPTGGVLKIGAPTPAIVAGVKSWNVDRNVQIDEVLNLGETSKRKEFSFTDWSGSFTADLFDAWTIEPGDILQLEGYPGGETTGRFFVSGEIMVETVNVGQSTGESRTPVEVSFQGNGDCTFGSAA